jgi:hypothetical protein
MFDDLRLLGTLLQSVSDEGGIIHRNYEMRDDIIEEKKREGELYRSFFGDSSFPTAGLRSRRNTQQNLYVVGQGME